MISTLQLITLQPAIQDKHDVVNQRLNWYGTYLKEQYLEVLFNLHSVNKWLPSPSQKIFNLAIIKKERIQLLDDEFVNKSIRGQVDDILLKKSPIELRGIFEDIKSGRKVVLIDGAPGSGKSTLTVHICQQWGRGELFNEFTVVILVQLRDPELQRAQSFVDLLPAENRETAEQAAAEIMAVKGRGVLWILDGWDELPSHLLKKSIFSKLINPKRQENPLSKTAVIVTSRPISSGDLCPVVSSRIEVLGFTAEEQRLFFTECLNNDTKAVDTLMERLSSNPAMEGSCYLPLNASIVAHLYLTNGSLPSTIHGIFSSMVQHCLSRYLHERQGISETLATLESIDTLPHDLQSPFEQLCKLAFVGARDNRVSFSTGNLEMLGLVSEDVCELGLLQAVPSIISHGRSVYHNFLHLSIQELLAAVYISRMPAGEQIAIFNTLFNEARFSAVLQFYAAITKLRASRPLLSLVPRFLRPVPASVYDLVRKIVRKGSDSLLVSLLNCLYEAQDISLCRYVGEELKYKLSLVERLSGANTEIVLYNILLLPRDCLSIGYFMASIAVSYNGRFRVSLGSCSLEDTGTKILMQSFCRNLNTHNVCEMTGQINLCLDHNEITEKGVKYIAEVLKTTTALKNLDLWGNPIGDKGLQSLTEALTTNNSLVTLDLYQCYLNITRENGPQFAEVLQRNETLRQIHLSFSSAITDVGIEFITKGLRENTGLKTLILGESGITDKSFNSIQSSTSTCKIVRYN